jgi:ferredoxin-type protein NapH
MRFTLARRVSQLGVLLLFFGTFHWGWTLFAQPIAQGNFSSSEWFGMLALADPFAVLQMLVAGFSVESAALLGAGTVLIAYGLVGGRVWCAWFCPVNLVTDLASWTRDRLGLRDAFRLNRNVRYFVLALALILSALVGVAAFEWISPIGMAHRGVIYGMGLGWTALLGIFLLDLLILRHGWCGHLCPLGAFYALLGRATAQVRVRFDAPTCTHCGDCAKVCPEPQVLNLKQATRVGWISSGECTNCGRCVTHCPEDTLSFDLRPLIDRHNQQSHGTSIERRVL